MTRVLAKRRSNQRHTRRARHARQNGAVMLVVMLILMVATASAAVSVHTTQSELQAAGEERLALQGRYASEAAMMSTIAWIDRIADTGAWLKYWQSAEAQALPPPMQANPDPSQHFDGYAEPSIPPGNRHQASRTNMLAQQVAQVTGEVLPLSDAALGASGSSGSSGSGGGASGASGGGAAGGSAPDLLGSFGPRQAYGMPPGGYIIDINDCAEAPAPAGAPVGNGSGGQRVVQFYCVITARAGVQLAGSVGTHAWTFGGSTYRQDPFLSEHDSRATILTPQMIVSN